jgi:hypothetical protein
LRVMGIMFGEMVRSMKVFGRRIRWMVRVILYGLMVESMRGNT